MRLYTTIKNERGGKKSTSDDTRIIVELCHKNKIIGSVELYAIIDDKVEGYRVIWVNSAGHRIEIAEEEKAKVQKDV